MSKYLIPTHLKTHIAKQLTESVTEASNTSYYVFASRHVPFAVEIVPTPQDTYQELLYSTYQDMVFGKKVTQQDVSLMIPKVVWEANTVYNQYDSNAEIFDTNFYVAVPQANESSDYHVFKVLDNNGNTPSTQQPSITDIGGANAQYYSTSDGYVWKYMYSISDASWDKFTTDEFMPVGSNTTVQENAVDGTIDVIRVVSGGEGYSATVNGTFSNSQIRVGGPLFYLLPETASSENAFYTGSSIYIETGAGSGQQRDIVNYRGDTKRITISEAFNPNVDSTSTYSITPTVKIYGDGTGAIARGLVNTQASNTIYKVQIVNRGQGYSYATLEVRGNTGGQGSPAVLTPVFAPPGGHGSNPASELGATAVGFGVSFVNDEDGTIPVENGFTTMGIIKDPLFANVELTLGDESGTFTVGSTVNQSNTNATGIVIEYDSPYLYLTNVAGEFITSKYVYQANSSGSNVATANVTNVEINNQPDKDFSTFDQRYKLDVAYESGEFVEDERVFQYGEIQSIVGANAVFHSNDAVWFAITNVRGVFNADEFIYGETSEAVANINQVLGPDLVRNSGEVIYLENLTDEISRANNQTEKIKLVLKF